MGSSSSLIHPRSLLERDQADGLDDGDDDDDDGDDGEETDEERFDYRAGVAEQLSSALEQVQPVVEKIQELINQADDENADEYGDQLSVHLNQIVDVGNSVADQMSSDQEFDAEDDTRLSVSTFTKILVFDRFFLPSLCLRFCHQRSATMQ